MENLDFSKLKGLQADLSKLNFDLPHYGIPQSVFDEMDKRNQEIADSITPFDEILAEQIKPIIDENEAVIEKLTNNYDKLNELYQLKQKELEESKETEKQMQKYNHKMMIIAIISAIVAVSSVIITILTAIL